MPFNIGFGELVVIGIVALIVIGPKDLPNMFRSVGRVTGRMRAMADEFRRTIESAADDAGVSDIKNNFNDMANYAKSESGIDEAQQSIREINNMRVSEIEHDASELEADLDEARHFDAEMETKRAMEAGAETSAQKPSSAKKKPAQKAAKKSSDKTAKAAQPAKPATKSGTKKPASKSVTKAPTKSASKKNSGKENA